MTLIAKLKKHTKYINCLSMNTFKKKLGLGLGVLAGVALTTSAFAESPKSPDTGIVVLDLEDGTQPSPALTVVGSPFTRTPVAEVTVFSTAFGGTNTDVVISGANFANDQFNDAAFGPADPDLTLNTDPHTLQLNAGPNRGQGFEIVDTIAPDTIVVRGDATTELVADAECFVIPDWTLNTLIGDSLAALPPGWVTGSGPATATSVLIPQRDGTLRTFYSNNGFWLEEGNPVLSGDKDLFPSLSAAFFVRSISSGVKVVFDGAVHVGQHNVELPAVSGQGFFWLGIANTTTETLTLEELGETLVLQVDGAAPEFNAVAGGTVLDALDQGTGTANADTVFAIGDDGVFADFYFQNGFGLVKTGFPNSPSGDVIWSDDITLEPGEGIVVRRPTGQVIATSDFNIHQRFGQ